MLVQNQTYYWAKVPNNYNTWPKRTFGVVFLRNRLGFNKIKLLLQLRLQHKIRCLSPSIAFRTPLLPLHELHPAGTRGSTRWQSGELRGARRTAWPPSPPCVPPLPLLRPCSRTRLFSASPPPLGRQSIPRAGRRGPLWLGTRDPSSNVLPMTDSTRKRLNLVASYICCSCAS